MIIKIIIIAIVIYIAVLALFCIFLKGATKNGNEYDERREIDKVFKKIYGDQYKSK